VSQRSARIGSGLHVAIIAGGNLRAGSRVRVVLESADLVIAADRGLERCLELGVDPDLVVGDFDSVTDTALETARARGFPIETHPVEKDATDGEIALREALDRGANEVTLLGALDGEDRLDHGFANLLLLGLPETVGTQVRLLDEYRQASLLRAGDLVELHGNRGDIVSLMPLTEPAAGITTWGLKYDLLGIPLHMGSTRGISNELVWPHAQIQLAQGQLLVLMERQAGRESPDE
jgi:thiamine pyrophosphokinase